MKIVIRKSQISDAEKMMAIFDEARESIRSLGIDQWQNGYPHREIIESDIARDYSRVVDLDGKTVATFAIICDGEPTYDKIYGGNWLTGETDSYIAIHRVAILISCRGRGIAAQIMEYAADVAKSLGRRSIRIDTHRGNIVMRKMLEKNGFSLCGTIYLENGDERVAYEKSV